MASSLSTWVDFRGAGAFLRMLSNESLLFALNSGCLNSHACDCQSPRKHSLCESKLTPGPYGEWPFSSLLCRTLWKSYLLSCRTKLAKLLCLKCFGRIDFVNLSFCPKLAMRNTTQLLYRYGSPPAPRSYRARLPIVPLASKSDPRASFRIDCQLGFRNQRSETVDLGAAYLYSFRTCGMGSASPWQCNGTRRMATYKVTRTVGARRARVVHDQGLQPRSARQAKKALRLR